MSIQICICAYLDNISSTDFLNVLIEINAQVTPTLVREDQR